MTNLNKFFFISTILFILFILFSFSPISTNFNGFPSVSKIYAVSNPTQQQLDQTASILSSIQSIINKLKIDIQALFGREVKAQADITTGLVGHWKFDESSGITAGDSSGNNNTGTLVSGPVWTTGKIGGALSFDGVNDFVQISNNISTYLNMTNGTISLWYKSNGSGGNYPRLFNYYQSGDSLNLRLTESTLLEGVHKSDWGITGKIGVTIPNYITDTNWRHVVYIWNVNSGTKTLTLAFDGNGTTNSNVISTPAAYSGTGYIAGEGDGSNSFNGLIDDVRIYNRALTQAEITELYNLGSIAPPLDTIPPILYAGSPTGALPSGTTQTTLSLATDENATCRYGTTANTAYASIIDTFTTTGGTSHSRTITGLTNGTSYNYYIRCSDASSNVNTTDYTISFSVSAPAGDTTLPTVSITSPTNGTTVSGTITISANATDNVTVAGVQFKLDTNTNLGTEDTTSPYSYSLNTATITDGSHTLTAVARDTSNNYATSSIITITVNNISPPPPDTTPPSTPIGLIATVISSSQINLSWIVSTDNVGVAGYKIYRCAGSACAPTIQIATSATNSYSNTGLTASTAYTYTVSAYDAAGNESGKSTVASATTQAPASISAFPGAEGFGAKSIGGRGGKVIKVTNLNDSGTGSFRAAVEALGPRIIVFDVSGIINLQSDLRIGNPYITIAGQTSPGGILVTGRSTTINTHDVIIHHMRFRVGSHNVANAETHDTIGIYGNSVQSWFPNPAYNIIIDHSSISWGIDENFPIGLGATDVTVQWSIVSEGLNNAGHPKGAHSKGLMVSTKYTTSPMKVSVHHNYFAHNVDRNPLLCCGSGVATLDAVNNVVYNFKGSLSMYTEGKENVNWIHNYVKQGPNSNSYAYEVQHGGELPAPFIYVEGNIGSRRLNQSDNQWSVGYLWYDQLLNPGFRTMTPWSAEPVTTTAMSYNYALQVLESVGASAPVRDSVDTRVVADFANGTGGYIDNVAYPGGFPTFASPAAPLDSDNDGMPNDWETAKGLNPNNSADANNIVPAGVSASDQYKDYTYIEYYIGDLADKIAPPSPDTTPPTTPPNLIAAAISSSQINLSWTASTDNVGVTGYKIYRCAGSGCTSTTQIATSTTNSYSNTVLTASTAYTYAISAYDAASNESAKSSSVSATTPAADATSPTVSITSPTSGQTVSGTITISANASDNVGVSGVQFKLDNANLGAEDITSPYSISWNTVQTTNGAHTLLAIARDASGNRATSSPITITTNNDTTPPTISSVISTTLASTTARIDWQTNELSTSQVEYGFTTQYGASSTLSTTLTTSHSVLLSNLSPDNTTYNYRVRSKDSSNNESISTNNTFITTGLTDIIPPASTTNLTANNITQTSVDLVTWTAAGDDGNQGTASSFDIRYATGELSENTWNNGGVIRATGEPTPKPAGSIMNYTLVGLTPNTVYRAALKTLDEVPNHSLISNIITFTTLKAETAPAPAPTPTPAPAPSSGGGGGGGGGGGSTSSGGGSSSGGGGSSIISDTTPAPKITELKAQGADQQVRLTWKNPESSDWVRTILVRKAGGFATSTKDGQVVFEGTEPEFTDVNLKNNQNYYYSLFTIDRTPNYSQPATVMVKTIALKVSLEEIKPAPLTVREQEVLDLAGEAAEITKSDLKSFLSKFNFKRDQAKEDLSLKQYVKELIKGLTDLMADRQIALNHFIAYGTATTLKLGAGERAGVVNSYKSAFNKLPTTAEEWTDAIKIANGRWPTERSAESENNATTAFKKIYKRSSDRKNPHDDAAVTVMAYGLRPSNRNLNSEKAAIKSFRAIYAYTPKSAIDWDIVRAIAYSGARR